VDDADDNDDPAAADTNDHVLLVPADPMPYPTTKATVAITAKNDDDIEQSPFPQQLL